MNCGFSLNFLGLSFRLSVCLFLAISPTLSPAPENQRHQDLNFSECKEKTPDFFFFFLTKPKFAFTSFFFLESNDLGAFNSQASVTMLERQGQKLKT